MTPTSGFDAGKEVVAESDPLLPSYLRRQARHSAVNVEELTQLTVSHQVDMLGVGTYQLLLLGGCGFVAFAESVEMGAVAPLHSALGNSYQMTEDDRATMAGAVYGGSALGVMLSAFLCDALGRKPTVFFSSLALAVVTLATALVPPSCGIQAIIFLRFLAGLACAVGGPASVVYLVECTPTEARARIMFAVVFINNLGYVILAIGLEATMPLLGEGPDDNWRALCFFMVAPAIACVPLFLLLVESPAYMVANKRDIEGCLKVLGYMGYVNGKHGADIRVTHVPLPQKPKDWKGWDAVRSLGKFQGQDLLAVTVLMLMDTSRLFFTAGSAYLWKDLFLNAGSANTLTPATINIVASISPLAGLAIGERFLWMGMQRMLLLCTFVGMSSLMFLTVTHLRNYVFSLIVFVMLTKLVYGPMATCVALLKASTFPTEIRAMAFCIITCVAKLTSIASPVLIETMKDDSPNGSTWSDDTLRQYILILVISVCVVGASCFALPKGIHDGSQLEDYVKSTPTSTAECWALSSGYNATGEDILSYWDIWDGTVCSFSCEESFTSSSPSSPRSCADDPFFREKGSSTPLAIRTPSRLGFSSFMEAVPEMEDKL